jgi:hypothetical protein
VGTRLIAAPVGLIKPLQRNALCDEGETEATWSAPKHGSDDPPSGLLRVRYGRFRNQFF